MEPLAYKQLSQHCINYEQLLHQYSTVIAHHLQLLPAGVSHCRNALAAVVLVQQRHLAHHHPLVFDIQGSGSIQQLVVRD